jgi:RND superfamily putative drug exporter
MIVACWLAALVLSLALAPRLRSAAVTDPLDFFPKDSRTRAAASALRERFPESWAASQLVLVLESNDEAALPRDRIAALAARLRTELPKDAVSAVLAPSDDPVLEKRLSSGDRRAALVVVRLGLGFASEGASDVVAAVEKLLAGEDLAASGITASLSGDATLGRDYLHAIEEGGQRAGLATVALVAVVLLIVHRSPVAALVSVATLGVALGVTIGVVTLAALAGLPVAYAARGFLVALVWGVGTDYGLLLLARVREEWSAGADGAPLRARGKTGPVLVTSAAAVAAACALMGFARFGLFRCSGPALALAVLVTLAAVLSLAPALMRLAGPALFWPTKGAERASRIWPAIARLVVARPAVVLLAGLAPLVWLGALGVRVDPSFELELDIPQASASEAGWRALSRHFDPAALSPLMLVVGSDAADFRDAGGLDVLYQATERLAAEPGVATVSSATQPTGEAGLLARATLRSQLAELAAGLARASAGASELARRLGGAEREIAGGTRELGEREQQLEKEQQESLLGAFAPGRFRDARAELEALRAQMTRLREGLGSASAGARQLADGIALGEERLRALDAAPGSAHLLDRLALTPEDVRATPELARAFDHYISPDARSALFELRLAAPPNSREAVAAAERVLAKLPGVFEALGVPGPRIWAGGATAITAELARLTRADAFRLGALVVIGVFVLLVAVLRRIAAPAAITAFILASYFAALGVLALLVRAGVWPGVDWKAPFFLFVLLVAIGADYGVFVLGRAREEQRALAFEPALVRALELTGPVITSCGLVLAGTFATIVLSRIAFLEQVAIGISFGVAIDTLLVRPFLLPAAALLLERAGGATARKALPRTAWLGVLLACALAAFVRSARADELVLDPATTTIRFTLGATLHTVHGSARLERGSISFDPAGGVAGGEVRIDARSLETGVGARDKNLHGDVLESERFPAIVLRPGRLALASRSEDHARVKLDGTLEIHGGRHALSIGAELSRKGDEIAIEADFTVPYVAWGMRDPSNLLLSVDKEVQVHVSALGRLAPAPR